MEVNQISHFLDRAKHHVDLREQIKLLHLE